MEGNEKNEAMNTAGGNGITENITDTDRALETEKDGITGTGEQGVNTENTTPEAAKQAGAKETKNKRVIAVITIAVVFAMAVLYGAVMRYFSEHYFPGTTIDAKALLSYTDESADRCDISGMTISEAENSIAGHDTAFTVHGRDGVMGLIHGKDICLEKDTEKCLETILARQDAKKWPLYYLGIEHVKPTDDAGWESVEWTYDKDALKEQVMNIRFIKTNGEKPENAGIEFDGRTFTIKEEKEGSYVDPEKALAAITETIDGKQTEVDIEQKGCYEAPSVIKTNEELCAEADRLNGFVTKTITIDLVGATETLTPETYMPWTSYNGSEFTADREAVSAYVDELSKKYWTYQTQRNFKTNSGNVIAVGGGQYDTYGFWMDKDGTTDAICTAITTAGEDTSVDARWKVSARTRNTESGDIGSTYIEVNIASQHLWYYVDGACVLDFDVVTGMDIASRRTPTGVFQVLWKDTEHTMKGSYGTSFCHFWMPITWEGVGIHDAYWRSSYGGDIWRGSGSHGCINTPYEKMKQLYSMAPEGTPVIVYQM